MFVSETVLKWAMRLYPPLLFQRILVTRFDKGFRGVAVKISKSFLNKNYNKAIFGGTIFAAADPFYPVLFYQVLIRKGYKLTAWSRSAAIRYLKPGNTNLYFSIKLSDLEISTCEEQLNLTGKFRKSYLIEIFDKDKQLCVSVINEIYIRNLNHPGVEQQHTQPRPIF